MKSYIAHVSSQRLFRALSIESNLARPVIIQIPTQSPGRYTAELLLRRTKLFFIPSKFALCAKNSHIVDFLGSRRLERNVLFTWIISSIQYHAVALSVSRDTANEPSDLTQ